MFSTVTPKIFVLKAGTKDKTGIWDWVCEHEKPVWIDDIPTLNLNEPVTNKATGDKIDPKYLEFNPNQTYSIMASPMKFNEILCGVYSVETSSPDRLTDRTLGLIGEISENFARIIKKAKIQRLKQDDASKAADLLAKSIRELSFRKDLDTYRCGFMARPFEFKFTNVEHCITDFLNKHKIGLKPFKSTSTKDVIITDIMNQIKQSHFCVADITKCTPNIMLEVGMALILNKPILILQDHKDETKLPFDLQAYHYYKYRLVTQKPEALGDLEFWNTTKTEYESIESILISFVIELEKETSFREAKHWISEEHSA